VPSGALLALLGPSGSGKTTHQARARRAAEPRGQGRRHPGGRRVRVHAEPFGIVLSIDLTPERHRELGLVVGETVYVVPRQLRVFVQDYSI
jgi:hypothetical protein